MAVCKDLLLTGTIIVAFKPLNRESESALNQQVFGWAGAHVHNYEEARPLPGLSGTGAAASVTSALH